MVVLESVREKKLPRLRFTKFLFPGFCCWFDPELASLAAPPRSSRSPGLAAEVVVVLLGTVVLVVLVVLVVEVSSPSVFET